jgi:menaquinone-dependent protoporphyrinogen IX oxidase
MPLHRTKTPAEHAQDRLAQIRRSKENYDRQLAYQLMRYPEKAILEWLAEVIAVKQGGSSLPRYNWHSQLLLKTLQHPLLT